MTDPKQHVIDAEFNYAKQLRAVLPTNRVLFLGLCYLKCDFVNPRFFS